MAYRNYINGYLEQDGFYLIVYEWIEENKFEYGKAKYKVYVAEVVRAEIAPAARSSALGKRAFLFNSNF